eukprot:m.1309656 g.1309656  ORF g.1309656 m.1309656 type:complete len:357 (+) comp24824_c0_seq31:351-1421(+)
MALRDANRRVTEAIKSIVGGLDRLAGLADMVAQGGSGNMQQSMYSIGGYLLDLNADHTRLHDAFPAKAQEEVSVGWLPSSTATVIQTTLSKIAAAAEALGKCLSADGGVVSGSGQHAVRGVPAQAVEACTQLGLVNELQVRAVGYMEKLRCDAPDTVPYTEALALKTGTTLNRLAPRATAASDSAVSAATIKSYQEKIAVLEQEREHSVLECQLLQMRVQALEGDDDGSGRGRTTAPTGSSSVDVGGENGSSAPNSKEISTIKKHYEERIQLLTTQLQFADSKVSVRGWGGSVCIHLTNWKLACVMPPVQSIVLGTSQEVRLKPCVIYQHTHESVAQRPSICLSTHVPPQNVPSRW